MKALQNYAPNYLASGLATFAGTSLLLFRSLRGYLFASPQNERIAPP